MIPREPLDRGNERARTAVRQAGSAQNDPRIAAGVADGVLSEADEMTDVAGHEGSFLVRGEGQLCGVGQGSIAGLVGAEDIDAAAP